MGTFPFNPYLFTRAALYMSYIRCQTCSAAPAEDMVPTPSFCALQELKKKKKALMKVMLNDYKYSLSGIPANSVPVKSIVGTHLVHNDTHSFTCTSQPRCKSILIPIKSSQELSLLKTHSDVIALPCRVQKEMQEVEFLFSFFFSVFNCLS